MGREGDAYTDCQLLCNADAIGRRPSYSILYVPFYGFDFLLSNFIGLAKPKPIVYKIASNI